ncbi:MAG TPA: hypothetical protein VMW27_26865 [Thermoanaerobaculia bacterium]|nr:hypothetical protein [Thermoanaerobaculia bacterium]
MEPIRDPEVLSRMQQAMDLFEAAEAIMRQNLRRWHPEANAAEIEARLAAWLQKRPYQSEATPAEPSRQSA